MSLKTTPPKKPDSGPKKLICLQIVTKKELTRTLSLPKPIQWHSNCLSYTVCLREGLDRRAKSMKRESISKGLIMSNIASASSMQVDYIQLLTTQLKNQNPMEPMDNSDMTAQLAQFSQLSQLETMNNSFAEVLKRTEQSYGTSLLGKEVSFIGETSTGDVDLITGSVDQVVQRDGDILLGVGNYSLTLQDIIGIKEKSSE